MIIYPAHFHRRLIRARESARPPQILPDSYTPLVVKGEITCCRAPGRNTAEGGRTEAATEKVFFPFLRGGPADFYRACPRSTAPGNGTIIAGKENTWAYQEFVLFSFSPSERRRSLASSLGVSVGIVDVYFVCSSLERMEWLYGGWFEVMVAMMLMC